MTLRLLIVSSGSTWLRNAFTLEKLSSINPVWTLLKSSNSLLFTKCFIDCSSYNIFLAVYSLSETYRSKILSFSSLFLILDSSSLLRIWLCMLLLSKSCLRVLVIYKVYLLNFLNLSSKTVILSPIKIWCFERPSITPFIFLS